MNFATARQRPSVSINDFLQRLENIVNTFNILQLEPPSKATQAMRFIQGLEKNRFSSIQTHFANELRSEEHTSDSSHSIASRICIIEFHYCGLSLGEIRGASSFARLLLLLHIEYLNCFGNFRIDQDSIE